MVSLKYQQQKISSAVFHEGIIEGITEGINALLKYIWNAPGKRVPQLADTLGIPAKTIERWIAVLKREGDIEFRGSKKAGGYFVTNAKKQREELD